MVDEAVDEPVTHAPDATDAPVVPLVVDAHEPEDVYARLEARGLPVQRRKLHPADYVIGPVAVERKSVGDFYASLTQKRLFEQVVRLQETYPRPVLLLEGDVAARVADLKQPSAFWGALVSIAVDLGVPVLPAPDKDATAALLARIHARVTRWAAREDAGGGDAALRGDVRFKPRALSAADEQKFTVQGLPRVGDVASARLLERFGTVRRVFEASEKELTRVPGIGKGKARAITELLDRPFEGAQKRLPGSASDDEE